MWVYINVITFKTQFLLIETIFELYNLYLYTQEKKKKERGRGNQSDKG